MLGQNKRRSKNKVVIIGAGMSGLTIGYYLARQGFEIVILEEEPINGGLASTFKLGTSYVEKFYHHWFTSDSDVIGLIDELGLNDKLKKKSTSTSIYYSNNFLKLSTPFDVIKFNALPIFDRLKLAALVLRTRKIKDWSLLEGMTARDWLISIGGVKVYKVIWEPLLRGKFGRYADSVSAVWFWNKIKLRGGSRGRKGQETLLYIDGGFTVLTDALVGSIKKCGGVIINNYKVKSIDRDGDSWVVKSDDQDLNCDKVIATTALPVVASQIAHWADHDYIKNLRKINYIGNICLVLILKRSLSDSYWVNVNDPSFPFVGLIEHTNFESIDQYDGNHIVYISKYLDCSDELYGMDSSDLLSYYMPYLRRMFGDFDLSWVKDHHVWRARWAQPIVEKNYSSLIPAENTPYPGFYICSMAQIYPEDRGTNYSVLKARSFVQRFSIENS